jgi:hypothetical protein
MIFIQEEQSIVYLLKQIIQSDCLHVRWLNTLSYLENCGARKIAACEHPVYVKETMLKHASEEFRHAHYLKRQMCKISPNNSPDYTLSQLLGGIASKNYLNFLDVWTCRYLTQQGISCHKTIKKYAYILVTYAIELRAQQLYPLYDQQLKESKSKIHVKSILLEEEEHLQVMKQEIACLPSGMTYAGKICSLEEFLFQNWLTSIKKDISLFYL